MKPPLPTAPPAGAWSKRPGPFHKDSDFCSHCKGEIRPGEKMATKRSLIFCLLCFCHFFPTYRN
jgi:hypothetical protein